MIDHEEKLNVEEKIDRYVNGELSEEEIDELWVEMIQHQKYIDYLKTSANLKEVAGEKKVQSPSTMYTWMYAAAAAIVLLLVVFGTLQMGYFESDSVTLQPVETIEMDYYRAADGAVSNGDRNEIIGRAIKLFNEGRFERAVDVLLNERNTTNDLAWKAELNIALGTLYYNTDEFNDAAYYFRDVVQYKEEIKMLTLEKAYWYLGNCYFQIDMLDEAEQAMEKAYNMNGAYSRVAKSYLDAMADARSKGVEW